MKVLITAGATREFLDPVRFLSNASSGRMAAAIAAEARCRRHRVWMLAGAMDVPIPASCRTIRVSTARQMLAASLRAIRRLRPDVVIAAAAVSDFRPVRRFSRKIPSGRPLSLRLAPNPDVLASLLVAGRRSAALPQPSARPFFVGFSLEHGPASAALRRARAKQAGKRADLTVVNPPRTIGSGRVAAVLLNGTGRVLRRLPEMSKARFAKILWDEIQARL